MFFVRDAREQVKANMPEVPKRDIMLEVGKMWHEIKNDKKRIAPYQEMALKDLQRFKREHAEFVQSINEKRHKTQIEMKENIEPNRKRFKIGS
jgi:uncharacterized protein YaaR (DUF327 family)